ncbi:hypothetical protein Tco_1515865 [Tanacetum coccineum]
MGLGLHWDPGIAVGESSRRCNAAKLDQPNRGQETVIGQIRVNMLFRDRRGHMHKPTSAHGDRGRVKIPTHHSIRTDSEITEFTVQRILGGQKSDSDLLETDRRRHTTERDDSLPGSQSHHLQFQLTALQGQVMTLQGQVTALQGQQGPAGGLAQPELPEEAGSSS